MAMMALHLALMLLSNLDSYGRNSVPAIVV
jgi:hypothetical protein